MQLAHPGHIDLDLLCTFCARAFEQSPEDYMTIFNVRYR